jgi:hypothetical protein
MSKRSSTYTVNSGYKIPETGRGAFKPDTNRKVVKKALPLVEMQKGDSFYVPCQTEDDVDLTQRVVSARACDYVREKAPTKHFVTRQTKSGVRVWRVR